MKKLSKLFLVELEQNELTQKEMNSVRGGRLHMKCWCGCCYAGDRGGSSTKDNGNANCGSEKDSSCYGQSGKFQECDI